MKKFKGVLIVLLTVVISQHSHAQSSIFSLDREINLFGEETLINDIKLNVKESINTISLIIEARIKMGDLRIEIYDPKKNKIGEFSIDSIITKDKKVAEEDKYSSEIVTGQIQKYIDKPMVGDYVIKIIPLKVYGNIKINTQFNSKN